MIIFSLVAMIGLEKCCITSAYLQWLCHSGEQAVAGGPLVFVFFYAPNFKEVEGAYWFHPVHLSICLLHFLADVIS